LERCVAAVSFPHYHEAMSFSETVFLFLLALIIFGPKKLPEIARQAGKLLAELRRASNEFRSQIETEIAHLEVQKEVQKNEAQKNLNVLPPAQAPQGTVASLSLNPASSEPNSAHQEPDATLAAPIADAIPAALPTEPSSSNGSENVSEVKAEAESDSVASHVVAEAGDPASQASHV
jgi:sec-independent protein translocase protein TatB